MTEPQRVIVVGRHALDIPGFTSVQAEVDGGAVGAFMIASGIVGTEAELAEIRAQSAQRMEAADQTKAGMA